MGALRRQVFAQVSDLRGETCEQLILEAVVEPFEARFVDERGPRVNPVLYAPRAHVARVEADGHLTNPGAHESFPRERKSCVYGFAIRVREVEAVVELAPL